MHIQNRNKLLLYMYTLFYKIIQLPYSTKGQNSCSDLVRKIVSCQRFVSRLPF